MEYFVHIGGERLRAELHEGRLVVEGEAIEADLAPATGAPVRSLRLGGRSLRVVPQRNGRGDWTLEIEGRRFRAEVLDRGQEAIRAHRSALGVGTGPAPVRAPMPGMVLRVEVGEGDEVAVGQGLVIVEAMKMENEIRALVPARVMAVRVAPGTAVEKDQILVELAGLEGEEGTP